MVDTGADVTVISSGVARSLGLNTAGGGTINLSGLSGSNQAVPFVTVNLQIENTQPFTTQAAIGSTTLNLLSHRDVTKVYDISITAGKSALLPKRAQAAGVEADNVLPPIEAPTEALNPSLVNIAVAAFVILLAISTVS
jgi:hypothetical protein